ncbi:MAG: hypothetical protein IJT16_01115 [Lachnospiraceae bacterium]|nr:hypothetical protein [Lachnospiraceae bacterium]
MITAGNLFLILIWGIVCPFILGFFCSCLFGRREGISVAENLCFGFVTELAVFYLLSVPMIYLRTSYTLLKNVWISCIALLFLAAVFFVYKRRISVFQFHRGEGEDRLTVAIWILFLLMAAFQTGLLTVRMHMDTDDARFVAEALEPIERNTMLAYNPVTGEYDANEVNEKMPGMPVGEMYKDMASPYPIFLGLLSDLFGLNPAIVAHTVLPALLIPLSYLSFYLAGVCILGEDKRRLGIYLLFLSVIHLFSFETTFAPGYTLLNVIWHGRSIAAMIVLPLLWTALMRLKDFRGEKTADASDASVKDFKHPYIEGLAVLFVINLACACLSGTAAIIAVILSASYAIVKGIWNKSLRLFLVIGFGMLPVLFCIGYGEFARKLFY